MTEGKGNKQVTVTKAHDAVKKSPPRFWMRNSMGDRSASLTLAVIAFTVTTLWMALSIFQEVGGVKVREFDATAAMAYLAPILSLYGFRRHTKAKDEQHAREQSAPSNEG